MSEAIEITATVADIKALLAFASTDEARGHICGITVSEGRLAATNGHVLAVRGDDPCAEWSPRILLPREPFDAIVHGKDDERVAIVITGGEFTLTRGCTTARGEVSEATPPPFHDVFAVKGESGDAVALHSGYLGLLAHIDGAIAAAIGRKQHTCGWLIRVRGREDPVLMTRSDSAHDTWTVLVMPVRL